MINVKYKIIKNEKYGDYRVHEYFNGKWNNSIDNNWTESQARNVKTRLEKSLTSLNGSMIVPITCVSTIGG